MTNFRVHHSLFWRTRLATSEGGFLITIQNIIAVAADNAYLVPDLELFCITFASLASSEIPWGFAYHVKMYCE